MMPDIAIKRLNAILSQNPLLEDFLENPNFLVGRPIVFIMGLPRSGTTPLAQLLVNKFKFGYITNLVARFWEAPEIGIALAKSISKDPGGGNSPLDSFYGFTSGYEGHHEFGYFWQRWFKFKETHFLDSNEQLEIDVKSFKRQLLLMENVWQRPLLFKNAAALPLQIEFLGRILPNSLFIHIQRDLIDVAGSLLEGRKKYLVDISKWFSIKPKEYVFLKHLPVFEQIAGQVYYANDEILKQLKSIPKLNKICLKYDSLCKNTELEIDRLKRFFADNKMKIKERDIDLNKLFIQKNRFRKPEYLSHIKNLLNNLQKSP